MGKRNENTNHLAIAAYVDAIAVSRVTLVPTMLTSIKRNRLKKITKNE
jgi:hypothetical protein